MSTSTPNVLLIMTDEERYTPSYEREELAEFRSTRMPARASLAARGLELHHHYAGSTACAPSRATLFTGQYPSLHGVRNTDGLAKAANDPAMSWLDPDEVPTLGDWFRAAGYQTHYRGKWHVSHADLLVPGTHDAFMTNTREGEPIAEGVDAYRSTDRLDPFGFSGWIGPEPHGTFPANTGMVRDGLIADQVVDLLGSLAARSDDEPWLAVASFVNPHDIGFSGLGWQLSGFPPVPDWVPAMAEPPSQSDSLDDRPDCQAQWRAVFPKMLYDQPADLEYRRLYHYLMAVVDESIGRVLASLEEHDLADDTIVVFTSDHGDLLGAHGGLQQKWYNAYDEAIHVPMIVAGPGIDARSDGLTSPTSHIDLVPTLLGLIGRDPVDLIDVVGEHHTEAHPLPGRDLSCVLRGTADIAPDPIYFMTEDQMSSGLRTEGVITRTPFEPVGAPSSVESVIAELDGSLWKLNHYYDAGGTTDAEDWELHDLSGDPEERVDRSGDSGSGAVLARLRGLLDVQRMERRLGPTERRTPG
jgi:arylsulfatase A-like enzyme